MNSICMLLVVAFFAAKVSAQPPAYIDLHSSNGAYITNPYDYFATPPETATARCALINTVMDESGSMETEQDFLKHTALPDMAEQLYSNMHGYDHVFVCSHGFGRRFHVDNSWYRYIGCSRYVNQTLQLVDPSIVSWWAVGRREDGYAAIQKSILNVTAVIEGIDLVQTCATMDKNIIMVTDEDRDAEVPSFTMEGTKAMVAKYNYTLNVVVPVTLLDNLNHVGVKISDVNNTLELFAADGAGGWRTALFNGNLSSIATNNNGKAMQHYYPLVADTRGALWAVESLRRGIRENMVNLALSFSNAFVYYKINEISCSSFPIEQCPSCLGTDCDPAFSTYIDFTPAPTASFQPTSSPAPTVSLQPSSKPTSAPTYGPTSAPTGGPTGGPTSDPTSGPTSAPTSGPTEGPTSGPTSGPSSAPTSGPTGGPTSGPTSGPSSAPTSGPTGGPTGGPTAAPTINAGTKGDPHFKTWKGEHFEFHGQCDLTLLKNDGFANGIGLNVQIRTKLVRYWSYIKSAAIRIGDDILEVQGSGDLKEMDPIFWFNFDYRGKSFSSIDTIGDFPLRIGKGTGRNHMHRFVIDLSSKYPGQEIVIGVMKEFVKFEFNNASTEAFGNSVGLLGEFVSGETLARDGRTVIHDFNEFGMDWQVLPAEGMLFHDTSYPQFPEACVLSEDPRGERRRRLAESTITALEAEEACAKNLSDPLDIKDCVYDILATQDFDMVGAF